MIWRRIAVAGTVAVTLLSAVLIGLHWRGQRDDLTAAISAASHAADKQGHPRDLDVRDAVLAVRAMGKTIDDARTAAVKAKADDAKTALDVAGRDADTTQEVTTDVLTRFARTRADLAAARARADRLLRERDAARLAAGGSGGAAVPYDPEPACRAYAGTDCDGLLGKLAAAQDQTEQLLGWQRFYPKMKATHDEVANQLPEKGGSGTTYEGGGDEVAGSAVRAP